MDAAIATSSTSSSASSTSNITNASATSSNATTVMVTASVTSSTSSSTSSISTITVASARSSNAAPVMVIAAVTGLTSSSISITNGSPAVRSGSVPTSVCIAVTSIATNLVSIHTTVNSTVASGTNTTNLLSPSVKVSSVAIASGMGGGSNHVDGGDALQSNEVIIRSSGEVEQSRGRRWRATLPIEVDDSDADDGAGLETIWDR
ncbi:uncharacterized protein [Montipora foliosa]|uniref:uncharacterized protein n=1 Tax=Montipora foliosa TaxID=591990 RepID=UPI0035F1AFFF